MEIQKLKELKRGYKLKILISFIYIVLLFTVINGIFTFTPLREISIITSGSVEDIFLNQLFSFISYMIIIIFFFINLYSLRRYRKVMEFYEIKVYNPEDPRIKGVKNTKGCGIWNPLC